MKKIIDIKIKKASDEISPDKNEVQSESKLASEEEFLKTITQNSDSQEKPKVSRRKAAPKTAETPAVVRAPGSRYAGDSYSSETEGIVKASKKRSKLFKTAVILILVFGVGFSVYGAGFLISRVDISIETQKETQSQSFRIVFKKSPEAQSAAGQIVLPLYEFKKSFSYTQEYPTTGQGQGSSFAKGEIVIFNENSTASQILIAGTRFESSDKKIFRLVSRTVVPGYKTESGGVVPGTVTAEVKAEQAGPDYNISADNFTIPAFVGSIRFQKIYGVSDKAFSGGASGTVSVITAEDLKSAKERITQYAYDTAKAEAMSQAPDNLKLLDKAVMFSPGKIQTPSAGETVDKFKAAISGDLSVFVFDENEVKELISEKLSETQGFRVDLSSASYQILYENPEVDFNNSIIALTANVKRDLAAVVDTLEFKQKISGKSIEDLKKELLKLEGVQKIRVSVWPFWVVKAPNDLDSIRIVVQ